MRCWTDEVDLAREEASRAAQLAAEQRVRYTTARQMNELDVRVSVLVALANLAEKPLG